MYRQIVNKHISLLWVFQVSLPGIITKQKKIKENTNLSSFTLLKQKLQSQFKQIERNIDHKFYGVIAVGHNPLNKPQFKTYKMTEKFNYGENQSRH